MRIPTGCARVRDGGVAPPSPARYVSRRTKSRVLPAPRRHGGAKRVPPAARARGDGGGPPPPLRRATPTGRTDSVPTCARALRRPRYGGRGGREGGGGRGMRTLPRGARPGVRRTAATRRQGSRGEEGEREAAAYGASVTEGRSVKVSATRRVLRRHSPALRLTLDGERSCASSRGRRASARRPRTARA